MSDKKENYYDSIYMPPLKGEALQKVLDAMVEKPSKKKIRPSLVAGLESNVEELRTRLKTAEATLEKVKELELKFKKGDILFNKNTGPIIFRSLSVAGDWQDKPIMEDKPSIEYGEPYITGVSIEGIVNVSVEGVVPYTESVRLLYESERD